MTLNHEQQKHELTQRQRTLEAWGPAILLLTGMFLIVLVQLLIKPSEEMQRGIAIGLMLILLWIWLVGLAIDILVWIKNDSYDAKNDAAQRLS